MKKDSNDNVEIKELVEANSMWRKWIHTYPSTGKTELRYRNCAP